MHMWAVAEKNRVVSVVARCEPKSMELMKIADGVNNRNARKARIQPIRREQEKISKIERFRRKVLRFLNSHHVLIIICVLVVLDAAMVIGQLMIDLYIIRGKFARAEESLFQLVGILRKDYPSVDAFQVATIEDLIHVIENGQHGIKTSHHKNATKFKAENDTQAPSSSHLYAGRSGLPRHLWNYKRKRETQRKITGVDKDPGEKAQGTFDDVTAGPVISSTSEGGGISTLRHILQTGSNSKSNSPAFDRNNARTPTVSPTQSSNQRTTSVLHTTAVISDKQGLPIGGAENKDGGGGTDSAAHDTGYTVPNHYVISDKHSDSGGNASKSGKYKCDCSKHGEEKNSSEHCSCDDHHDHLMLEIAHAFHLGSLCILALMTLEKCMKGLCQGKELFKKKMEIFDSFVVISSFILDVVLLQGIWSEAEKDAALFLVCLLPWRVIRIVNCFVMTMKQRHYIRMQLQKHARRKAQKKLKLFKKHLERLKRQIKSLKGLCRKHGAEEREINACAFVFTESRRRKSSLPVNAMSTMASLALIGVIGNDPHMPRQQENYMEEVDLDTLDEQDEEELEELAEVEIETELHDIEEEPSDLDQAHGVTMNGNCNRDRKVSSVSGTDSIEISCASVSMEDSGSPTWERRLSNDSIIDIGAISDESYADTAESDDNGKDDKILKSRRFSTTDFLYNSKRSMKKRKKGK